jgi:hypothetical protein
VRFYFVFFIIRTRTTQFVQRNSYCTNCIQIVYKLYKNCIQIATYEFVGFCTNSYKIIQFLYELYSTNSYKVRVARAKPELRARSASGERAAQAARAKPELRARGASGECAA